MSIHNNSQKGNTVEPGSNINRNEPRVYSEYMDLDTVQEKPFGLGGGFLKKVKAGGMLVFVAVTVILLSSLSFGLGRLSVSGDETFQIEESPEFFEKVVEKMNEKEKGGPAIGERSDEGARVAGVKTEQPKKRGEVLLVGSKNSDKYHLPGCPGARQIHEDNKLTFSSFEEAEAAGYEPAGNCEF